MDWRDSCVDEISKHHCFFSALHRQRFMELFEMVQCEPFLTKEIAKCIFLAAWQRPSTDEMAGIFQKLIDEEAMEANCLQGARDSRPATADEWEIFKLAQDFLAHPEETPDEACLIRLSKAWIPLGDCALQVSEIIDSL